MYTTHLPQLHYFFSILCTALALALNIKHTTALYIALLVAVSLIFTPTRLLRRPRATKPLLDEDDGKYYFFCYSIFTLLACYKTMPPPKKTKKHSEDEDDRDNQ